VENVVADARRWAGRPVLVTGCTGLVGAWLSDALCAAGARVVGIARNAARPSSAFATLGLEHRVAIATVPIENASRMQEVLDDLRPAAIFHLAAASQVGAAQASPLHAMRVNVGGTVALLEAVRLFVPGAPVICASTTAVYGANNGHEWAEDSPLAPGSAYAGSKAAAEMIARTYAASYGLKIASLRCTNVYGPGDPNLARLVPSLVGDLLNGRTPRLRSAGTAPRDFLYVEDAVRGFARAAARLDDDAIEGGPINLSAGTSVSALEMTRLLARLTGHPGIVSEPGPELESVPGAVSAERARVRLGWTPQWTLEDGLRETVRSYISTAYAVRGEATGQS
jgi:CDP-glucose 4,6-dehydratase